MAIYSGQDPAVCKAFSEQYAALAANPAHSMHCKQGMTAGQMLTKGLEATAEAGATPQPIRQPDGLDFS